MRLASCNSLQRTHASNEIRETKLDNLALKRLFIGSSQTNLLCSFKGIAECSLPKDVCIKRTNVTDCTSALSFLNSDLMVLSITAVTLILIMGAAYTDKCSKLSA